MRSAIFTLGIASILAGILQLIFVVWAGEASWHLGSPIRLHGDISGFFADHPRQSLVDGQYQTGLRVIDTLESSLGVHLISGVLFVGLGIAVLCIGFKFWRSSTSRQPPNNSFKPNPHQGGA